MTADISAAAATALAEPELARVTAAFGFMKMCAERADVPHAHRWQLHHMTDGIVPWRVIDLGATPGQDSTRNVAFTLRAATARLLLVRRTSGRRPATLAHLGYRARPDGRAWVLPPPLREHP